mgnify:CR=1 FL=1
MEINYHKGWEGARMAVYKETAYVPIACITSRSEGNTTNTSEKTNVCTQGKTVTKANSITRTVSLAGEIVDENSYYDLKEMQSTLQEQVFRVYKGAGETNPLYFKGIITDLSADFDATEEGATGTFTMDIAVNGDYTEDDPMATP